MTGGNRQKKSQIVGVFGESVIERVGGGRKNIRQKPAPGTHFGGNINGWVGGAQRQGDKQPKTEKETRGGKMDFPVTGDGLEQKRKKEVSP